jgi:hypothetical protein
MPTTIPYRRLASGSSGAPGPRTATTAPATATGVRQAATTTVFMILSANVCRLASHNGNSQPM